MTDLEKKILSLFRQLSEPDKDFMTALARAALKAQEKGETFTLPAIQKKEAEA